jgi:tape measure domain-containing protein
MSENVGTIYYDIDVNTAPLEKGSTAAEKQLDRTERAMEKTDKAAGGLTTQLTKLSAAFAAVVSAQALRAMADMVQKYEEYADRVRGATSSADEFDMVQKRLLATANGTYRSLGEAQELYIRTADSLRSLGYSTSQALDVTDSMSYAFVTNATSADRAGAAIDALSKSVNTGKVAADQWETITSAIPSVINDIAAASGKTAAEVRNLGAQGKLTAFQLTEGLRKSLDATAKAAGDMSNNLVDAGVRSRTALTQVLVSLEQQTGALASFTNGIITAADAVLAFGTDAEKMESFLNAATTAAAALGSVIAGRLLTSLGAYAVAQGQALAATVGQMNAARASAQANTAAAASDYAAATAALAKQKAVIAAGGSMLGAAADANALAVAQARATAAAETLTAAQAAQASVASRLTVAMGGLRTVMGFLGGPAGLILLAATALYTFATNADSAKTKVDALNGSLEKLSFNQLSRAANEVKDDISGFNKQLSAALSESNTMTRRFYESEDQFKARQQNQAAVVDDLNQALKARQDRLVEIAKAQDALSKKPAPGAAPTEKAPVAPEDPEAAKRIKALKDEEALLKVIGVERAKLKALQALGDEASPAQRLEAERLAASIYNLEQAEAKQKAAKKKGESEAEKATKKAATEQKKGIEENIGEFKKLGVELASVGKTARDLAMDQAQLSLNKYATPEQIQSIRDIAGALYDARNAKQQLAAADPIAAEQINYDEQLKQLQDLNNQKLLSDQRYLELKGQAEREHVEQMRILQEENFKAATLGNELLLNSIDALGQSGAQALSGLLSGTSNLNDALGGIANTVLNAVIGAFVEMGVNWVKQQVMMQAQAAATTATQVAGIGTVATTQAGATAAIAATTTTTAATTGSAVAASMAPAAGLSSIASFGGAAVIGGAALLATMLLAKSFGGGRKAGGPVTPGVMYRVNEGGAPEVFNAGGQQYMIPNTRGEVVSNKDATGQAGAGGAPIVNVNNYGSSQATASAKFSEADRTWVVDVVVADMQANGKTGQTTNRITGTRRAGS